MMTAQPRAVPTLVVALALAACGDKTLEQRKAADGALAQAPSAEEDISGMTVSATRIIAGSLWAMVLIAASIGYDKICGFYQLDELKIAITRP